jgi:hypothetical protein
MARVVSVIACLIVISGCATHMASYTINLGKVVDPAQGVNRFGETQIMESKEECKNELFHASWDLKWTSVGLRLVNVSDTTLYIHWDECVFVDTSGACHHVIPSEILYRDYYESVKSAKVPPGCMANVRLVPRDNIRFTANGWDEVPYLPKTSTGYSNKFTSIVKAYVGKSIQVLLTVESDNELYDYHYVFDIIDSKVLKVRSESEGSSALM